MSNINKTLLSNVCLSYNQPHLKELFSDNTINKLSLIITQKIKDQIKKNIQVTNNIISDTLTTLYKYESEQFLMRFPGRENTLTTGNHRFEELLQKTINIIVNQVCNEYITIDKNKKLSIWDTVLGDFNRYGLRAHQEIKLNNKRNDRIYFNMNY